MATNQKPSSPKPKAKAKAGAKVKAGAKAAEPKDLPDPDSYTPEQKQQIEKVTEDWKKEYPNTDDREEILALARKHCPDAKYVKDGIIFPCSSKNPGNFQCVPSPDGIKSKHTTDPKVIEAINKKHGTKIDWGKIGSEEGGQHLKAYVPWIISFQKKSGGTGVQDVYVPVIAHLPGSKRVKGLSSSGVTVASGVDLGAWKESELKAAGVSAALIEKLKPYLGKKRAEACKAARDKPLTLTKEEADELDKASLDRHTGQVKKGYEKVAERYENDNKGKELEYDFDGLTEGEQTALASRNYQNGNIKTGDNKKIAIALGNDDSKAAETAYKNRGDYEKYKNRYNEEIKWRVCPPSNVKNIFG